MYDDFKDENIIKRKKERMLHIGSEDTYFISKEVYDAEVGDGEFVYWEEVIKEFNAVADNKNDYYYKKTVAIEQINTNSLMLSESICFENIFCDKEMKLEKFLAEFYKAEKITLVQQIRFEKHYFDGITASEIAQNENVKRQAVSKSIKKVWKKIVKYIGK